MSLCQVQFHQANLLRDYEKRTKHHTKEPLPEICINENNKPGCNGKPLESNGIDSGVKRKFAVLGRDMTRW